MPDEQPDRAEKPERKLVTPTIRNWTGHDSDCEAFWVDDAHAYTECNCDQRKENQW